MIRAGIIGIGYWGPNLLRNLIDNPEITVVAACDLNAARWKQLGRRFQSVEFTTDPGSLIKNNGLDLIVIATPVHGHFELAKLALQNGKHVLITKPLAKTEIECRQLLDLSHKHHRLLMVDHTFVYHPAVQYLKGLVRQNGLGELLYFHSSRMNLGLYQPDVSVIYDLMPHDLSILNELIDEDPVEISVSAKHAARLPQPDIAYMHLNYASNFVASIQASWLCPTKVRETIVTGRQKMAIYDDVDVVQKIKVFDKGVNSIEFSDREKNYTHFLQYRQGDIQAPAIPGTEALKLEIDHLVDCLTHNKTPRTDGYQGLRVVRLLETADTLARTNGCWTSLPNLKMAA
ncbi:MAG: Gfo/Idh/MocA family oxidoreductase [Deltaproteobacteria bacterium]|nr:Gfo/Idh/MocA family oxidoreductase [Deltaproteobacteria bacterium]MBI3293777.1 Gfo/Idh/MocA family oxidoreductase [Deltaproteobacteria bacterium]